jgi:putative chitinase
MILYDINGNPIGEIYDDGILPISDPLDLPDNQQLIYTSKEKLADIFYEASEDQLYIFWELFNKYAKKFKIETEVHENFFLTQIVAETGYALKSVRENLNYSCDALKSTFSYYQENPNEALEDGRCNNHPANEINIGNKAYANRIGNGDIHTGDGYKFRGGGYFQFTGRGNYQALADSINNLLNKNITADKIADHIESTEIGLLTALAFWYGNNCFNCNHIDCVTEIINKYTDSYDKREEIYLWISEL